MVSRIPPKLSEDHGETLAQYEERAFALYFVNDIRFPYVAYLIMALLGTWLLRPHYSDFYVGLWLLLGVGVAVYRESFVRQVRPLVAQGLAAKRVLRGFTYLSLVLGVFWGTFVAMYLDPSDYMRIMLAGAYVAGHIGGAVTPLSTFLPAFYAFAVPMALPGVLQLAMTGEPIGIALAGLTSAYFFTMSGYAHITNRLHRESMRLRFDNQRLIAELEKRNAEVESASRNKSLFLAGVSHDLKQPIRAIGMYTGVLRHSAARNTTPPALVAQTAGKIEAAISAIHDQISRLLELSRLESGAIPLKLESLDLDDVFTPVHHLLAPQAQARGVQLRFALGRQRQVWADRRMLESIVTNFISNAIKHTEGGRVYVGTRWRTSYPEGQRLCIEVRDSGSGIATHQLPLLFEAYRSFDDRAASESHGLGLAIAKAQATYLGCDIVVASKPGLGSTFTLCGLRTVAAEIQAA
jgi:signal transduction histidine kinase